MDNIIPVQELYTCLQGEGKYIGVPHILIRTTGCPLRCQFSYHDFCDSWYTSWHPKKGIVSFDVVEYFVKKHPHISHVMITGGSPTMHEDLLVRLVKMCKKYDKHVTIETEGSKFVQTEADMISLSPKFENSKPIPGSYTPAGRLVTEQHVVQHEKKRLNWEEMGKLIKNHPEFQIKPVVSNISDLEEIDSELNKLTFYLNQQWRPVYFDNIYLMPAGGTREELDKRRVELMEYCVRTGYNYTERLQIVAYNNKIGV